MMARATKILGWALGWSLATGALFAHYHFLHYPGRTGPFTPIPEKFDLNALPNRTLYLYVSEQGPDELAPGDSLPSVLSQIRMAAKEWSGVESSEIRLEFGGLFKLGTPQATPRVEVVFEEVPPGLIALGGPTTRGDVVAGENGAFVPITRSVLVLQKDLSARPSYGDAFFLTLVHELGHTLGLQHTMTSSVMSTAVTRATTRSKPLAADDVAGLSLLYPAAGFAAQTGIISGRVTLSGLGVHLASVVALGPSGAAVSTLTDPDGYYKIGGLPPGLYYLYVHPLPPSQQAGLGPADVVLPVDPQGKTFPAGGLFETQFYPGTKDIWRALVLSVGAGANLDGYDFALAARGPLELYGVTTYSFPGNYAVKPAYVNMSGARTFFVASGVGLTANGAPAPGLSVSVLGGSIVVGEDGVHAYPAAPAFLQVDLRFNLFSGEGARHLIFSRHNDLYVLPAGVIQVFRQPPSVGSVTPALDGAGNRIAWVGGTGLSGDTRIYFDGLAAPAAGVDDSSGALGVIPPQGASGHRAVVSALNPDGQSSTFLDAQEPPVFTYDTAPAPFVFVSPASLPAGAEAMVEVTGVNTNFADGQTVVGFGTSDVVVRRVWVLSPARLLANVHVAADAAPISTTLTVVTGFELVSQPLALHIGAVRPQAPVLNPVVVNPVTGQPSIYSGGQAVVAVVNLAASLVSTATLTLNDLPVMVLRVNGSNITFAVPGGLSVGPAVLRLSAGGRQAAPVVVAIDPPPPVIVSVMGLSSSQISTNRPAILGELLRLAVAGLADPGAVNDPSRVRVNVGGVQQVVSQVTRSQIDANLYEVQFTLSTSVPAGDQVPLTVSVGSRLSQPAVLPVRAPDQFQP